MNYKINKSMLLAGFVSLTLSTTSFAGVNFWEGQHVHESPIYVIGGSGPDYCDGGPKFMWSAAKGHCVLKSEAVAVAAEVQPE